MKVFTHILILIAFLGGILAPACGFSWGENFSIIEICTAQGTENRIVGSNDNEKEHHHQITEQCPFCFQQNNFKIVLLPSAQQEKEHSALLKAKTSTFKTTYLSKIKSPQTLRGPPSFLI
ncbi:MAG: hypothetical protein AAF988_08800 [Pseudomonadota bacterium]